MNSLKKSAIIAFSSLFLLGNVNAATCGYEEKAKLNSEIVNVKANYEIKERILDKSEYSVPDALIGTEYEDSYVATTEYIQVNILNLTENMYVEVTNDYNDDRTVYQYKDAKDGNISFDWHEINDLITYTIKVYASSETECDGTLLKTISQKLPRFNEYSDYSICNNFSEYYLCQRYVTYEKVDFNSFAKRMNEETEKKIKEDEQKNQNEKWYKKVQAFIAEHKIPFIIGGVILVVAIGGTTFIIIKKRRRNII